MSRRRHARIVPWFGAVMLGSRLVSRSAALGAASIALAGCGSAASTRSRGATTGKQASSTRSVAHMPAPCQVRELVLTYLGGQGATGHGLLGFALRNHSGHPCRAFGYPAVRFTDRSGQPLPTAARHTTSDFFGSSPLRRLDVAPGATISFRLAVSHGSGSRRPCPTAAALQIIPPRTATAMSVAIRGGAYECGRADVSPLQLGLSAYPRPGG
jgi:hypothetical protein